MEMETYEEPAMGMVHPVSKQALFAKLKTFSSVHINMPLKGISETADLAEACENHFKEFFWNTPSRGTYDDLSYISTVLNGLKGGNLKSIICAHQIVKHLESKNVELNPKIGHRHHRQKHDRIQLFRKWGHLKHPRKAHIRCL